MSLASGLSSLRATVRELAVAFVGTQRVLDRSYRCSLQGFRATHQLLEESGQRDLASMLTPIRQHIPHGEITARVAVSRQRERGFGLEVRLLNLGFERRFQHAEMSKGLMSVKVRQTAGGGEALVDKQGDSNHGTEEH